ncbi:MAG: nucleotidyltransferase family protein [Thermoplasmata archaeon]
MAAIQNNHAAHPRVFGSVARGAAGRGSDVDILVDFERGASAFDQVGLIDDLENLLGRRVEVTTVDGLHWLVRPQVLLEAVPL